MQTNWSDGYAAELPYLPTYLLAQAPAQMALACALAGVHCRLPQEDLTILDLGCGRGMAILALAAANPGWTAIGLDYMPAHVAEAREIAGAAGLDNARFIEADLAALTEEAATSLLPELDVVTLHGVWTWVSDRVREGILRVIRSRLKPGGLVMVTYNPLPGWAGDLALQRLIRALVDRLDGPPDRRMLEAFETIESLRAAGAPALERSFFLRRLGSVPPGARPGFARYAVHEFLPEHWRPAYPQDVAAAFAEAKLDPVGPAALARHFPALTLEATAREAMAALPAGVDRQFVTDLFAPPTFRQDIFVRGRRPTDADEAVAAITLALTRLPQDGRVRLDTPNGTAELPPAVIGAALAALAERPCSIAELMALPEMARTTPGELLAVLAGSSVAAPVWRPAPTAEAQARAQRFNRVLLAELGSDVLTLGGEMAVAAPLLGAGLPVRPVELAALLSVHDAAEAGTPAPDVASIVRGMMPSDLAEESFAMAEGVVAEALAERRPAWRALGLVR